KPKASARRKRGGSDSSTTPPTAVASPRPITTVIAAPRLTATAKGKQPARATNPNDPSEHGGSSTDERTGSKPGVLDVPSDDSEEEISWNSSDDEDVNDQDKGRHDDEGEKNDESDADDDDQDDAEKDVDDDDDDNKEEIAKLDKQDETKKTPEYSEDDGNGEEDQGLRVSEEQRLIEEEEADELYRDVDINQGRGLQVSQDIEDSHVTLTPVKPDGQQESSSASSFVTSMLNSISDAGVESIFTIASSPIAPLQTPTSIMTPSTIASITTSSDAPIPPTTIPSTDRLQDSFQRENDEFLHTIDENMKKIIKGQVKSQVKEQVSRILPRIEESVNAQLKAEVLTRSFHSSRTSYAVAADLTEMELKKILMEKMEGNKEDVGMMMIKKDPPLDQTGGQRDKEKVGSMNQLALYQNKQPKVQAGLQQGLNLDICQPVSLLLQRNLCKLPVRWTNPHIWCLKQNKTLPAIQGSTQTWISELAKQADSRSSFNELLDTPIDFSNFIINRLGVDTLTPELLAGPTYELIRGSCTSLTELEYHLEEVYKAIMDQLDWVNPEGQQYPHNLLQPLPLIPDNQGRHVIPFAHFINIDLEYLRGGASSQKYTTSVTKTKAADYGHIKWIEDLVPRTMWIQEPLNYDKHALWGDVYKEYRHLAACGRSLTGSQKLPEEAQPNQARHDKKNRLMRIDELHKFSDGTLNDVRNALDDRLKGIRMQYLPQTIWRKGDKDRAAAMSQSIDKMLKTRRIMRSLVRFVGGRLYEGDFRMLQRTI
nr:hypothetical protein [Tanacetum cinerariifolium]